MQGYKKQYPSLTTTSHLGPLTLIDGEFMDAQVEQAARIVARYSQGKMADEVELEYVDKDGNARELKVAPLPPDELPEEWMV